MGEAAGRARLVVFAGLPGAPVSGNPVGYVVAERVAADQLHAGRSVVADAVNGVEVARQGWNDIARDALRCSPSFTRDRLVIDNAGNGTAGVERVLDRLEA